MLNHLYYNVVAVHQFDYYHHYYLDDYNLNLYKSADVDDYDDKDD